MFSFPFEDKKKKNKYTYVYICNFQTIKINILLMIFKYLLNKFELEIF